MTGQYLWPFFCSSLSCPQAFIRDCCRLWLVAFLKCLKGEEISLTLELHLFNSLKEIKVSMWLFFFLQACSVIYLCLGRLQTVVLGSLMCCPSLFPPEKHAVLGSYIYHWLCYPLQAVPFPNIWTDLQQDTAFMACQVSLQRCSLSKEREHPSVVAFFFFFTSILPLLPNVLLQKDRFSENKKPACTMHLPFARSKRTAAKLP